MVVQQPAMAASIFQCDCMGHAVEKRNMLHSETRDIRHTDGADGASLVNTVAVQNQIVNEYLVITFCAASVANEVAVHSRRKQKHGTSSPAVEFAVVRETPGM